MPTEDPNRFDLSNACWRCQYWGGLVVRAHAKCTRLNATLQASPATGCVYWAAGAGDKLPLDWLPDGFHLEKHNGIWGTPEPIADRSALPQYDRPTNASDAFKYDQQLEAKAWAAADALMARARRRR